MKAKAKPSTEAKASAKTLRAVQRADAVDQAWVILEKAEPAERTVDAIIAAAIKIDAYVNGDPA